MPKNEDWSFGEWGQYAPDPETVRETEEYRTQQARCEWYAEAKGALGGEFIEAATEAEALEKARAKFWRHPAANVTVRKM